MEYSSDCNRYLILWSLGIMVSYNLVLRRKCRWLPPTPPEGVPYFGFTTLCAAENELRGNVIEFIRKKKYLLMPDLEEGCWMPLRYTTLYIHQNQCMGGMSLKAVNVAECRWLRRNVAESRECCWKLLTCENVAECRWLVRNVANCCWLPWKKCF